MASEALVETPKHFEPWARLDGKVVMVTGASSGLGLEFCLDLSKAGCKIIAAARRIDRLQSLCDDINNQWNNSSSSNSSSSSGHVVPIAVAVELDLCAKEHIIDASVQKAWDAFGRIDTVVNNGGYRGGTNSALDIALEEWNRVIATNLTGSWLVAKSVCKRSRESNLKISVINISSISGIGRGSQWGGAAYAASKAGLNALTRCMAVELGAHNMRVKSLCPGLLKSEMTEGLMKKEWLKNVALKTVPLRTYGTTDPIVTALVRFLIHDSSSQYVTGNIFIPDAGQSLPGVPIFSCL